MGLCVFEGGIRLIRQWNLVGRQSNNTHWSTTRGQREGSSRFLVPVPLSFSETAEGTTRDSRVIQ